MVKKLITKILPTYLPLITYHLPLTLLLVISGCAPAQMPGYISRIDHPYERKIYGSFEKVVSSTMFVLKSKGWAIISEADPSVYERDDRYDNNVYQNLLIITDTRKKYHVLYSTFMRLNIFIHSTGNTCDVEIRYEAQTLLIKQFISVRNDRVARDILDAIEQEVNG